jgi:hypothetical protein
MVKSLQRHEIALRMVDLRPYTFERRRSEYLGAKSDLIVYDAEGRAVMHGREFDGALSFWAY